MSQHSPLPWRITKDGDIEAANGRQVVWAHPNDDAWHSCNEKCWAMREVEAADMARIVACVNACAEISTEVLQKTRLVFNRELERQVPIKAAKLPGLIGIVGLIRETR